MNDTGATHMPSANWVQKSQGLFSKRLVGVERLMTVTLGTDEKTVVNGLIMDIFNLFNSYKLKFEKKNLPPLTIDYRFNEKDVLFVYAVTNPANPEPYMNLHVLGLAQRAKKGGPLTGILVILCPGKQATSQHGEQIAALLDEIRSPYAPGIYHPTPTYDKSEEPPPDDAGAPPSQENI